MLRFRSLLLTFAIVFLVFTILFTVGLHAQPPGFKATPLLQSTFGDDAKSFRRCLVLFRRKGHFAGAGNVDFDPILIARREGFAQAKTFFLLGLQRECKQAAGFEDPRRALKDFAQVPISLGTHTKE